MRLTQPSTRAAVCLLILLSPVGAPFVGVLLSFCADDKLVEPNGLVSIGFSYCGVSRPIEHLYQKSVMLSLLPLVLAGPIGGLLTLAWWIAAIGSAASFVRYLWQGIEAATLDKL
jgi:hypothetical protein